MKIVVCIKQVPDTQDITWTEKGTMNREGVESIMNPYDEYALEYALQIKDKYPDTRITVLSMGPTQAKEMLRVAMAKGADNAVLACDKKFSGSDTFATSTTIAQTIKTQIPDFDLIICGQFAIDGDTAQTPPSLASHLNIDQITFVTEITDISENKLKLKKETEEGFYELEVNTPCLISVMKNENFEPRNFTIKGYINSYEKEITVLSQSDLQISDEQTGFKGSPTYVSKSFTPNYERKCQTLEADSPDKQVQQLLNLIEELQS